MRFFQINLNHRGFAQDLLECTTHELEMEAIIVREPYRNRHSGVKVADSTGGAAMWSCGRQTIQRIMSQAASGFLWPKISGVYVYRY